jgi:hypothetical protein
MEVRLNGGHLHIYISIGEGYLRHSFFFCFVGLGFDEGNCYLKQEKNNGCA